MSPDEFSRTSPPPADWGTAPDISSEDGTSTWRLRAHRAFELAVERESRDDLAGAERAYRTADELGHAKAAVNLGLLLAERPDFACAEEAFARADERGHAAGAFHLGWLLRERGDVDGALEAYRRADRRGHRGAGANLRLLLAERDRAGLSAPAGMSKPDRDSGSAQPLAETGIEGGPSADSSAGDNSPEAVEEAADPDLFNKVARTGLLLGGRRVIAMLVTAITTAVVARSVGAVLFGVYAAALSSAQLVAGVTDFGFSLVLGRDLAKSRARAASLIPATLQVQTLGAGALSIVIFGLAVSAGLTSTRGEVLLVLLPIVMTSGLACTRQYFLANFEVRFLAFVDVGSSLVMGGATIAVAEVTKSVVAVAIVFSAVSVIAAAMVARVGLRRSGIRRPTSKVRRDLLRAAAPLGVISILSTFYFVIDLALLGFLVTGPQLGNYAAAVKILSVLVAVPGLVMSTALPGLSRVTERREELNDLAARLLQTMAAICLPLCVAAAVFAPTIVHVALGSTYRAAIPLIRILSAAGALSCLANVLGVSYIALRLQRPQIISNTVALIFNVVGNIILAPRYGVAASAWLTLATEALVAGWALVALRHHLEMPRFARVSWRPMAACLSLGVVGLLLGRWPPIAIPAAVAANVVGLSLLGGWPPGLDPVRRVRNLGRTRGVALS